MGTRQRMRCQTSPKTRLKGRPSLSLTAPMQLLQWRTFSSCFLSLKIFPIYLKIFLIYLKGIKYKFLDYCICDTVSNEMSPTKNKDIVRVEKKKKKKKKKFGGGKKKKKKKKKKK